MEDQTITIHVTGNVEAEILEQGVKCFKERYSSSAEIFLDTKHALAIEDVFDPQAIELIKLAVDIGTFLSVIFYLAVDVVQKVRQAKWDHESFLKAIEAEMKQQGVTDYTIESITNFGCLQGKGDCPCEVTITSSKSTRGYRVLLFRDGKAFTFEVGYHVAL